MSEFTEFAKDELERIGAFDKDNDFYHGKTGEAVMELIEVFDKQNHSEMSASIVAKLFYTLTKWLPLSAIDKDEDWVCLSTDFYKHKRCPGVYKENGIGYYMDAIVWQEDGSLFTGTVNGISSAQIIKEFPFYPKTFYIKVKDDKILEPEKLKEVFEYYGEGIEKVTWREFLSHYDFSNWRIYFDFVDCCGNQCKGNGFINRYTPKDFLNKLNVPYDAEKHIIYWGSFPTEIVDWDTELEFYVVYVWIDEEKIYEGWTYCFFNKEEAEAFLKS